MEFEPLGEGGLCEVVNSAGKLRGSRHRGPGLPLHVQSSKAPLVVLPAEVGQPQREGKDVWGVSPGSLRPWGPAAVIG